MKVEDGHVEKIRLRRRQRVEAGHIEILAKGFALEIRTDFGIQRPEERRMAGSQTVGGQDVTMLRRAIVEVVLFTN
jgi:hypothetical protein